jgi:hypothetical protein
MTAARCIEPDSYMGTLRQKKAAKLTLETIGNSKKKTKGEILKEAGYSPAIAINPQEVFESKGFIEELENFGLTEDLVKTSLVADIKAKPKKRFLELSLGADILGLKKQGNNGGGNTNIQVNIINYAGNNAPAPVQAKVIPTDGA